MILKKKDLEEDYLDMFHMNQLNILKMYQHIKVSILTLNLDYF